MANIKKIKLPSGSEYAVVDEAGRGFITAQYQKSTAYSVGDLIIYEDPANGDGLYRVTADISAASNTGWAAVTKTSTNIDAELKLIKTMVSHAINYRGYTTTALQDGDINPVINIVTGPSTTVQYTAQAGDLVIYQTETDPSENLEFLYNGEVWNSFGQASGVFGALAYADTASSLYTPAGSVSVTLTQTSTAASITRDDYTPAGTISTPTITVTAPTGTVYSKATDGSVTSGVAASFTQGSDAFSQGTDTFTQGEDEFVQGEDTFTAATLTTSVANEILTIAFDGGSFTQGTDSFTQGSDTFSQGTDSFTQGSDSFTANTPTAVTLPTFESKSFVTGATAALDAAPTFTGTKETGLKVSSVSYDKASVSSTGFTGTEATITVSPDSE